MSAGPTDAADVVRGNARASLVAVFIGGMAGGALRLLLVLLNGGVPWGILIANVGGALLLGFLFERLVEHRLERAAVWAFVGPGLCGALTTFSALQLELVELARGGEAMTAVAYLLASLGLGVPAAASGRRLGRLHR